MSTTDELLEDRGELYGRFEDNARLTQALKFKLSQHKNWHALNDVYREALEMIVHKISRILNGDPHYQDSWADIAGYAELARKHAKDRDEVSF